MQQKFLNSTTHSVSWFHKRYEAGELVLKAPFQRNPVWTDKQKSYLIDTILRGYPVPELYMQEFTDEAGNEQFIVVDGQQRLRACEDFIAGKFSIDGTDSPEWADMEFDDLSPDQKKQVYNYNFVVRVLPEMPDQELRSMFQRLNRNVVALNRQELRHATYWGQFITCVERLADDDRWTYFSVFTPNDVRRMLDIEFISEIVISHLHGPQNKKDKLDEWYQAYEREFEARASVEHVFNVVIGELRSVLPELEQTRWRKKSDFYTLFLALAENTNAFPLDRQARDALRNDLQSFAVDVDRYLKDNEANADVSSNVKKYSDAVERAASDIANRKARAEALLSVIGVHLVPVG